MATFGFLLSYYWVAARFLEDVAPLLVMLSVIGFWKGYRSLSDKPFVNRVYMKLGVTLAILSMLSSALVALSVNQARFEVIRFFSLNR